MVVRFPENFSSSLNHDDDALERLENVEGDSEDYDGGEGSKEGDEEVRDGKPQHIPSALTP